MLHRSSLEQLCRCGRVLSKSQTTISSGFQGHWKSDSRMWRLTCDVRIRKFAQCGLRFPCTKYLLLHAEVPAGLCSFPPIGNAASPNLCLGKFRNIPGYPEVTKVWDVEKPVRCVCFLSKLFPDALPCVECVSCLLIFDFEFSCRTHILRIAAAEPTSSE